MNKKNNDSKNKEKDSKENEEENLRRNKGDTAMTRQVFNLIENIFDEKERRVKDLAENSRVTLPKPLSIIREVQIGTRRNLHDKCI